MDNNSWLLLQEQEAAHRLPPDLAARDPFGARDCGWVEQMRPFIRQFCPEGGLVIDPFCGFGTTLMAAHLEGRRGIGVELEPARAGIAQERMARARAPGQTVLAGDIASVASGLPPVDLVLTNIPYFGCRWPEAGDAQLYNAATYAGFLEQLHLVFKAVKPLLREGGHVIAMAENLRIGQHFVPLAWDLGRILAERYELVDERILLYQRATQPLAPMQAQSNRSHEYALIARKQARPVDLEETLGCLRALAADFSDFVVYGSFARWMQGEPLARPPSDADLLLPDDPAQLQNLVRWLEARGFQITRWGAPLSSAAVPLAAPAAHYFRAQRLRASGELCVIDACFEDERLSYPEALGLASAIGGIKCMPSGRDRGPQSRSE